MAEWAIEVWHHSRLLGTYPVGSGLTIGRSAQSRVRLDDPAVSRHHAFIRVEGGRLLLRDVGSKSGTFVNNRPVRGDVVVRSGDVITIGPYTIKVVYRPAYAARMPQSGSLALVASHVEEGPIKVCPRCGTENPARARYCLQCGEPLVAEAVSRSSKPEGALVPSSTSRGERHQPVRNEQPAVQSKPLANVPPRSFWGSAILVFLFYLLGVTWPVAVIVNWIVYNSARHEERLTGQSPPGMGCLGLQLFLFFWLPLFVVLTVGLLLLAGSGTAIWDILQQLGISR